MKKTRHTNRGKYKPESGVGVVGLIKASFLFESGHIVQFEKEDIIKIQEPGTKEIYIYKSEKLFPDAMNAMEALRKHIQKPQLLLKD